MRKKLLKSNYWLRLTLFITVIGSFCFYQSAWAIANTKSIDLENGSSQYLYITDGDQTGLDITGDITIEFWSKVEDWTGNHCIASKWDSGSNQRAWNIEADDQGGGNHLWRFQLSSAGSDTAQALANTTITAGTWEHWAFVLDATNGSSTIYRNGVWDSTTTGLTNNIYNSSAEFAIGERKITGSPSNYFDGFVDEFRIWNTTKTGEEIMANTTTIYTGSEAGLVGFWRFEDDLLDETGNNNDLTNVNSAPYNADVPFASGDPPASDPTADIKKVPPITFGLF